MSFYNDLAKLGPQIQSIIVINQLTLDDVVGRNKHLTDDNLSQLKLAAIKLFSYDTYRDAEYNYFIDRIIKADPHLTKARVNKQCNDDHKECESCARALLDVEMGFENAHDVDNVIAILNSARDSKLLETIKLRMEKEESHKPTELNQPKGADLYRLRLPT